MLRHEGAFISAVWGLIELLYFHPLLWSPACIHLFISCCLMFTLHIIKRSGCNLQGHNVMEVIVELIVELNVFEMEFK